MFAGQWMNTVLGDGHGRRKSGRPNCRKCHNSATTREAKMSAKRLDIRKYGDSVLRERAKRVEAVTEEIRELAAGMLDTMHREQGVGVAAQQVGRTEAICVVEIPADYDVDDETGARLNPDVEQPLVMINPEILAESEDEWSMDEGCLSFPDIRGKVVRPWGVKVKYTGLDGVERERDLWGFMARAAQHEIDHLGGTLFIDHFSHVKKLAVKGKLRRLQEETQEAMRG